MTKLTYWEQLNHPNWQRVRLERLNAAGWKCEACGRSETTLHVHHKRYVKGRAAWEYSGDELAVLCDPCHQTAHETRSAFLHLLCYTESFPQAGITEADLLSLCWHFLFAAAGGVPDSDIYYGLMPADGQRAALMGHAAAVFFDSNLSLEELSDLPLLFDQDFGCAGLKSLLATARSELMQSIGRQESEEGK